MRLHRLGAEHHIANRDREGASAGHRIARVYTQVDQHLVKLRRVRHHRPQILVNFETKRDIARKRLADECLDFLHEMAKLHAGALSTDPAAEQQHLADDAGPAAHALLDHVHKLKPVRIRHLMPDQIGRHQRRREDVVEVVRNAARQRADRLHALRPQQLLLKLAMLGDILGHTDDAGDVPGRVLDRKGPVSNPTHVSVWPDDPVNLVKLVGRGTRPYGLIHALAILGVNCLRPGFRPFINAVPRAPPDAFIPRAQVEKPSAPPLGHPENLVDRLDHLAKALLAIAQSLCRPLAAPEQTMLLHGVIHRRTQPRHAILEQVVGRAMPHRSHRHVLADAARHDDERNLPSALLQQLQGAQAVEIRQFEIRQDDVDRPCQALDKIFFVIHHDRLRRKSGLFQLAQQELGVRRDVFNHENFEGTGHGIHSSLHGSFNSSQ